MPGSFFFDIELKIISSISMFFIHCLAVRDLCSKIAVKKKKKTYDITIHFHNGKLLCNITNTNG